MLDISDIKQYIAKYEKADSKELVDEGVDAFLQNHVEWKQAIERIYGTDRGDEIYGDAFVVFTVCLFKSERLVDNLADYVSKEIRDIYCVSDNTEYTSLLHDGSAANRQYYGSR